MTRIETAVVAAAVAFVVAVNGPAVGQFKVVGDEGHAPVAKGVNAEVRGGKGKAATKNEGPARMEKGAEPKVPTFTVSGGFESTKEKARESAIRAAVEKLQNYLSQQDPPVHASSNGEMVKIIKRMLVRHPDASQADGDIGKVTEQPIEVDGKKEPMYLVEVAIRVEPEHVRVLRSQDRSRDALWVLAGMGGLAGLLAMFFRVDAWTKGYLTSWLVLGTVGTGSLLAGLWWMAK